MASVNDTKKLHKHIKDNLNLFSEIVGTSLYTLYVYPNGSPLSIFDSRLMPLHTEARVYL